MLNENRKTQALFGCLALVAVPLVFVSALGLLTMERSGWLWCAALLVSSAAAGRFTVPVIGSTSGEGQSRKSIAQAFIILAVMLYGAAPATLLAGIDGLLTTRRSSRRLSFLAAASAIVSTGVASYFYAVCIGFIVGENAAGEGGTTPLGLLLLPLCVFTFVQYCVSTLAWVAFFTFESGQESFRLSRETLVWTAMTQMAAAVSAAIFYTAKQEMNWSFLFVGITIIGLVYLLYRFDEQRADEGRRAEAEKLRHVQEIADLHMNTIESLAIAIDAKDQTTHGHVRRTQIYAMELGRMLGVSEPETQALRAGALLHDVGKLAVPEYILNKPGKLTAAEFDKMKIHTIVGGDIVRRVNFPYPVEDIVRYHHEKWDGTGYPKGMRGEQIPLVARIIAVVDFYDATRCDRPYRVGMKREDSLGLLQRMSNSSFDPRVVATFASNIDYLDNLIAEQDIQEQVASKDDNGMANARPDAGLASDVLGSADGDSGFRSIAEAQREVYALHEIAQTIGSSLNLHDTVTLVTSKLRSIVPFDICVIYLVDERSGKAAATHVVGDFAEAFARRRVTIGEGITGWVIANARSMCNTSPELDLVGIPANVAAAIKGVLVAPLIRENGAFGAITLYSTTHASYSTEQVRLLESVAQHAASALNNALTFERTKESALTDPLTELPNARSFNFTLEQRVAECQRHNREPLTVLSMDLDDFKHINDSFGHGVGDRLLASVAALIKKQLRQMDILARYAGDEFVAIMPMASGDVAVMVAERIRAVVESEPFAVRTGRTAKVGISIGLACFPNDGETAEELLTCAGRNMQHDKHSRRLAPPAALNSSIVTSIDAYR